MPSFLALLALWLLVLTVSPASAQPAPAPAACSDQTLTRLRPSLGAVVSVESGGMHFNSLNPWPTQGFLASPRHVVTALSTRGVGRSMWVTFATGERIGVTPVASLEDEGMLLLELDRTAPAAPLPLASADPRPGAALAGFSQWRDEVSLRCGVLLAGPSGALAFRSASKDVASFMTPFLDLDGRVVGLSVAHGDRLALAPVSRLQALLALPRGTVSRMPALSLAHMSTSLLVQTSEREWMGLAIGGALTARDRLQLRLSLAGLATMSESKDAPVHKRFQVETAVGYRQLLLDRFPLYVVPELGLAASWESATLDATPSRRLRPTFGVHVLGWAADLGYSFQPGTSRLDHQHQLTFGLML